LEQESSELEPLREASLIQTLLKVRVQLPPKIEPERIGNKHLGSLPNEFVIGVSNDDDDI
jgi:hypothetical protein